MPTADPALLQTLIGHYARLVDDVQQLRIAAQLRAGAMRRDGLGQAWTAPIDDATRELRALERAADRQLARLVEQHPLAPWIAQTPGVGPGGIGRLLGVTGPLDRFSSPAHLWSFLGLHVVNGQAPRRNRHWSLHGHSVCYRLALALVRTGHGPYREAYLRKKTEYLSREPEGPSACVFGQAHTDRSGRVLECRPVHVHQAALRYTVKLLVRDLWIAWKQRRRCALPPDTTRVAVLQQPE